MSNALSNVEPIRHHRADIARSLDAIRAALEEMRFGSITLAVHDGRVVQLDVTERTRFPASA